MLALERVRLEGNEVLEAQRYFIKLSTGRAALARRQALVARLDAARRSSESSLEVVLYLVKAFVEAGSKIFPDEPLEYDDEEMRRLLTPSRCESNQTSSIVRFRNVSDAALDRYVSHWETEGGKRVAKFLNTALESGAMEGGDVAMEIIAGKRRTVP